MSEPNDAAAQPLPGEQPSRAARALAARAHRPATSAVAVPIPITVTHQIPDLPPGTSVSIRADLIAAIEGRQPPPMVSEQQRSADQAMPQPVTALPIHPASAPPLPAAAPDAAPARETTKRPVAEPVKSSEPAPQPPVRQPLPAIRPPAPPVPAVAVPVPPPAAIQPAAPIRDEAVITARAVRPVTDEPAEGAELKELSALLERARRVVSEPPDDVTAPPAPPQPAGLPITAAAEPPQAPVRAAPAPQPLPPPVSIGEIHIYEASRPAAPADPLALLAPYAGGLTARRSPAGAR